MMTQDSEPITIEVNFYDGDDSQPFATSSIPIGQLPETFEIDTVLHLGPQDWIVRGAVPAQKKEFERTRTLSLYLTKHTLTQVDVNNVLFSLPTLNDEIAAVEAAESMEGILVVHEDEWRQVECIAQSYDDLILEELQSIDMIYEHFQVESGFKKLHLRTKISAPLKGIVLRVEDLHKAFTITHTYQGVAFSRAAATVERGFAMQANGGWILWGQMDTSGIICVLNVMQTPESTAAHIAPNMDAFLATCGLYLLHWSRLFFCGPQRMSFASLEA